MSPTSTVRGLISLFALRRRASTPEFADGVRLARLGAAEIDEQSPTEVRAHVQDGDVQSVRLFVADNALRGECTCEAGEGEPPCRHQVAVAHVVWVKDRRGG